MKKLKPASTATQPYTCRVERRFHWIWMAIFSAFWSRKLFKAFGVFKRPFLCNVLNKKLAKRHPCTIWHSFSRNKNLSFLCQFHLTRINWYLQRLKSFLITSPNLLISNYITKLKCHFINFYQQPGHTPQSLTLKKITTKSNKRPSKAQDH